MIDVKLAGRYRLEGEIGSGGMTVVWQALDEVLERPVAVKILHHHLLSNEVFCEQFRRNALAGAALLHPHIVAAYDTGEHAGAPYVVMEYLGGGSLGKLLADGPLAQQRVAAMGAEVCEALAHSHAAGVIHRDLKPSNILFTEGGQVKVTDFGVGAAALGGDLASTGALLGTLSFLAPEVLDGVEPGVQSDLYALGVVLFRALTGRVPRPASDELGAAHAGKFPPAHPRDFRPEVPKDLDAAVARALSPLPGDRFADAAEMGVVLRTAAQSRRAPRPLSRPDVPPSARTPPAAQVRPSLPAPESFVRSEGRWLAPVVLLVLTAVAVVLGVLQLSGKGPRLIGGTATATPPKAVLQRASLAAGGSFNPPPGDGSEHTELVPAAFDNNPATSWKTQSYDGANFGGLKPGVGIYGDLGTQGTLKQIEVDTPTPGWQGTIRWSDDAQTWSNPGPSETVDAAHVFSITEAAPHRYWMVWVTHLVPGAGGFQVQISEIKALR